MTNVKVWIGETRPQFLLLTPVCVFAGLAAALYDDVSFHGLYFSLAFIGALCAHITVNVLNDYLNRALQVDINFSYILYNIAWYKQKAVLVLLAFLLLGVKNIILGPILPLFVMQNVLNLLGEKINIQTISTVKKDIHKLFNFKHSRYVFGVK